MCRYTFKNKFNSKTITIITHNSHFNHDEEVIINNLHYKLSKEEVFPSSYDEIINEEYWEIFKKLYVAD